MPLGMKVRLGPCHVVLDGDPALPPQQRGHAAAIFSPCLLWPNGWMDQDATWTKVRLGLAYIVLQWNPASPNFRPMPSVAKRSPISATVEHLLEVRNHSAGPQHAPCLCMSWMSRIYLCSLLSACVQDYLQRYGYLEPSVQAVLSDRRANSAVDLSSAIKRFQRFAGLRETGERKVLCFRTKLSLYCCMF